MRNGRTVAWPLAVAVTVVLAASSCGGRESAEDSRTTGPSPPPISSPPPPPTSPVLDLPPGQTVTITAPVTYRVPVGTYRLTFNVLGGQVRVDLRGASGAFDDTFTLGTISRVFTGPAEIHVTGAGAFRVTLTATPI